MLLIRLKKPILAIQRFFLRFEHHHSEVDANFPPVFIVGAPRTGSTLLFQLLLQRFRFGYISNLMALFPMLLSRVGQLSSQRLKKYDSLKESDYGVISGLHAPNEAAKINDLWFERPLTPKQATSVRSTIYKLSRAVGGPVLMKSLGNALRVENVLHVFPDAKFIFIKRDPLFTAQSILLARKALEGSFEKWWSIKPTGYEKVVAEDPYRQVLWQIATTENQLMEDLKGLKASYMEVDYRHLCERPLEVLSSLQDAFGFDVKNTSENIKGLRYKQNIRLEEQEWQQLTKAARDLKIRSES